MGDSQGNLFSLEFNRSIHLEARPECVSGESGSLLMRELMDRLGYPELLARHLCDARDAARVKHPFQELLRTALLMLVQGWGDQSDVQLLRDDPALRLAVSGRRGQRPLREADGREPDGLCSQPTLSRLVQDLGLPENVNGLLAFLLDAAERRMGVGRGVWFRETMVDLDSLPREVFGHQPGSAWNRHYGMRCYHPVVARSEWGDYLGAKLRPGNVHTADGGLAFVLPILRRARAWAEQVWLRIDAGYPEPKLLEALDEEGFLYVARVKTNAVLERLAAPYLALPRDSASGKERVWTHELRYQAGSWTHPRRVVLVIVERVCEQGELFVDHFFLLSNASVAITGKALLERYRKRGAAEKDFGDWNQAVGGSLSSAPRPKTHYRGREVEAPYEEPDSFAANEARLLLELIAANLLHAGAELLERDEAREAGRMSRERFRHLVLKVSGRALLGGGTIRFVIDAARAELWRRFMRMLNQRYPARGSPAARALPVPA
ncbi:MAG TPA: IS1380 family transposase [Nostoc sp.]|uniref:IS1380 family transposase n=1 Tax=Nostoc sp. TaxID=1180 RepID=UPI002D4F889C|nr:IS1380 family transposase [Nostoc sp.]HYX18686.1 IS1380 family transposase [Nostoc sp.]